ALATLATSAASAAPGEAPRSVDVICDAIGADTVTLTGDLSRGGTAEITHGPLTIVGEPGFVGRSASGTPIEIAPTGDGAQCTATSDISGPLTTLLPAPRVAAANLAGAQQATGRWTFTVVVDEAAVLAAAKANPGPVTAMTPEQAAKAAADAKEAQADALAPQSAADSFPFSGPLGSYIQSRPGNVTVAVRRPGTSTVYTYTKGPTVNITASIVKVELMAGVMLKAQDSGRALTAWEKSQIVPMIRSSDNNAATALFNYLGGRAGLDRVSARLGLFSTRAEAAGHWGLTTTSASDQTRLIEHFAKATGQLTSTNRTYGRTQMLNVTSSQDWGVSAGPPAGTVALKNGWLPRSTGYHANSIGLSTYSSPDYAIAVLTQANPGTLSTQISTIEGVSKIVWSRRAALVPAPPPPPKPKAALRNDFTGDGRPDLMAISKGGSIYRWPGVAGGGYGKRVLVQRGWSSKNWIGSPGDLNKDGRADLLVREDDGRIRAYYSLSGGKFGVPRTLATGKGSFTTLATGVDIDKNGTIDVIGRRADGELRGYSIGTRKLVILGSLGNLGRYHPQIYGIRDVNGDGRDDLRAFTAKGEMRVLYSRGRSFTRSDTISSGWKYKTQIAVPGDPNRDRRDDLVAAKTDNTVQRYWGTAGGGLRGATTLPTVSAKSMRQFF
ncbi:FG-GAP-like repeat-containing protein, partial [Kribbia dieselivorans]|uniref:FG-GAP-like repeat-containing protein n=1 Tax=Kribbia dieselivorans TaxID=331526 RepID=UPI000838DAE2